MEDTCPLFPESESEASLTTMLAIHFLQFLVFPYLMGDVSQVQKCKISLDILVVQSCSPVADLVLSSFFVSHLEIDYIQLVLLDTGHRVCQPEFSKDYFGQKLWWRSQIQMVICSLSSDPCKSHCDVIFMVMILCV